MTVTFPLAASERNGGDRNRCDANLFESDVNSLLAIRDNSGNRGLVRDRVGIRIIFLMYNNTFAYKFVINTVTFWRVCSELRLVVGRVEM